MEPRWPRALAVRGFRRSTGVRVGRVDPRLAHVAQEAAGPCACTLEFALRTIGARRIAAPAARRTGCVRNARGGTLAALRGELPQSGQSLRDAALWSRLHAG